MFLCYWTDVDWQYFHFKHANDTPSLLSSSFILRPVFPMHCAPNGILQRNMRCLHLNFLHLRPENSQLCIWIVVKTRQTFYYKSSAYPSFSKEAQFLTTCFSVYMVPYLNYSKTSLQRQHVNLNSCSSTQK